MNDLISTNRVILFEKINEEKLNLLTLISEEIDIKSLSDDKIEEINKNLVVSSFSEFLEKFKPKIYSYFDKDKNTIAYSLEKPNIKSELISEINLDKENTFLNMLISLIETREKNKVKTINFNYEDILDYLSPKKIMKDLKQLRSEIAYLYDKYEKVDDKDPLKLEIADKLNYNFHNASKNYNNVLAMLPLAINDIEKRLFITDNKVSKNTINKISAGKLSIGANGELEIISINTNETKLLEGTNIENQEKLALEFRKDYNENSEEKNPYIENLITRTFAPVNDEIVNIEVEKEIVNYNNYVTMYKMAQENFIEVAKELIKKIIGVKLFFSQYDVKNSLMKPKLLITNIDTDELVSAKNLDKLEVFLNTVNNKNDFSNTIWFSIIPNIEFNVNEEKNIKKRFRGSEKNKENTNSLNTLISLTSVLSKYKIQSFFNFEANYKTDFKTVSLNGIDEYIEKCKLLENKEYSEYLIACIPNFTLIPKNMSKVNIASEIRYENEKIEKSNEVSFYINGIYIDSSYIAAGITASMQCPNYLSERYTNVLKETPGVRINIEAKDNAFRIKTNLAKEISGYTKDIKNRINELNFGYIFTSDEIVHDNKLIDNIMVYKARSLSKNTQGTYEPIYKTTTTTYIERVLRYMTADFKEEKLDEFFSNNPNSVKSKWLSNTNMINSILKLEDDISIEKFSNSNTFSLNLKLSGEVRHLKLLINGKE
ncbi:transcriptional regulator [Oceanivirga miroungae]|uniref:Uncharacterized protein n=1 Tax=Oceanivirga miroungae TaxID=1130046 RepID=A0A6I8M6B5_9FUSO|nr:transcriptional regulator [Oceanivirga miroungae]VWL84901.1 hypothetical protein OMES3154_00158 [Oceanivirga miroungae]